VRLDQTPYSPPPDRREEAVRVWVQASTVNPRLVDNEVLTCRAIDSRGETVTLRCAVTAYRFYYAQHRAGLALGVLPLAVSGALRVDDPDGPAWLLGRRGAEVTQYPRYLECVPSGGLESSDIGPDGVANHHARLLSELKSETALDSSMIDTIEDVGVVSDRNDPVVNVLCLMTMRASVAEVYDALRSGPEYPSFQLLRLRDVAGFLRAEPNLVPTSRAALTLLAGGNT
jgi:hypothetical protein